MVFAMLLGSLNYGASLGFTLTFLLTGLGLVVMHHCHNNLLGTTIKFFGAAPVFAGERAEFKIAVSNDAAAPRFEIELNYREHTAGPVDVATGGTEILRARRADRAPRLGRARTLPSRDAVSRAAVSRVDLGPHGYALPRLSAARRSWPALAGRRAAASTANSTPATTTSRACARRRPATRCSASRGKHTRATMCCC